ncbi:PREDICTED: protein ABIL4 isoform X2 [Tarenaya hassleriana]|uniref:protein ABIL4 isoform X2 n=1 Tax=Tarenaya hassleriana TaxID=28532 RepID=UPI00053C09AC|nr:PREDICTED: protein ABIL4 isoform X2 [Tarenaya hassleriana]
MSSTSLAIVVHQASNHDELFMKQTLRFSETLRDLKNMRKQLYSAADYFETSYDKEDHKEVVIETLKDYAVKALVNTVDHLGSVSDKFNGFLSDNTDQFSTTDLRLRCLEQRMKSCREYSDQSGAYQQLRVIESPQYHKRYFFPDEDMEQSRTGHRGRGFSAGDDSRRFASGKPVRSTIRDHPTRQTNRTGTFSFSAIPHKNNNNNRTASKRSLSPMRFPLLRSGSLLKRSISPSQPRKQAVTEPRRAKSVSRNPEIERRIMEIEQCSRKGKSGVVMFKALMSISKSRKDRLFLCPQM